MQTCHESEVHDSLCMMHAILFIMNAKNMLLTAHVQKVAYIMHFHKKYLTYIKNFFFKAIDFLWHFSLLKP